VLFPRKVSPVSSPSSQLRSVLAALAVSAVCVIILWLWAVPSVLSRATFAFMAVFMIGGATVSLITWRNAQATSTVGQLLHATEAGSTDIRPKRRATARHTPVSR
jgi:hypothetical protein